MQCLGTHILPGSELALDLGLDQWFSKWGTWPGSIISTQELVGNADSWAPPQTPDSESPLG